MLHMSMIEHTEKKVNKDLQTFRDKYYMQDLTTPQTQSDIY